MPKIEYDLLTRNGKEEFVVVPRADYEALIKKLEDEADYRELVKARKASAGKPTHTLAQVKRKLGMTRRRTARSTKAA